jgi:hypothetical protein
VFAGVQHGERTVRSGGEAARKKEEAMLREQLAAVEAKLAEMEPLADPAATEARRRVIRAKFNIERFKPVKAKFAIPPVEDAMKVAELSALVKAEKFLEAVAAADRASRQDLTPLGASYAAMLSTQAYCGRKDQGGAQARFRTITNPTHRDAAKAFCAKYIDVGLLSL